MGSATFFQEDFTASLRADVNGKTRLCQESEPWPSGLESVL